MTIASFPSGSIGPTGPTGPSAEQTQNSAAFLAWLISGGVTTGHDLQANGFASRDGIDQALSLAEYNELGSYYERSIPGSNKVATVAFDMTNAVQRKNLQGVIFKWVQDSGSTGHFEGVTKALNASAVVDKSGGKVGLPCTNHGYATGTSLEVRGTVNYNGTYSVDATSSTNEIVITKSYISETLTGVETVNQRVTLGAGNNNVDIEKGIVVSFLSGDYVISNITSNGNGSGGVDLFTTKASENIVGMYSVNIDSSKATVGKYKNPVNTWSYAYQNEPPPPRSGHPLIYDSTNKLFWVFGGSLATPSTYRNDLWKFDPATKIWTQLSPTGTPPVTRRWHTLIHDPVNNTLLMFGGHNSSTVYQNDLWKYDISANTWTQLNPTGGPPTIRGLHSAIYDSVNATMLVYGGWNGTTNNNELWKYTIATNTWAQITFSGSITARREQKAIYESSQQLMWIWGGYISNTTNELWKYDIVANTWTQITQSSPPSARYGHGLAYDPANRYMYLYAGYSVQSDFYRYNLATNTWTTVTPTAGTWTPEGRHYFNMGWDPISSQIFLYGGYTTSGSVPHTNSDREDYWFFNIASNTWTNLAPCPRSSHFQVYCSQNNSIFISVGFDDFSGQSVYFRDLWKFDIATSTWSRPYNTSYPTNRNLVGACYDSVNNCIWMYGGSYGNSEFWKFDIATSTWIGMNPSGVAPDQKTGNNLVIDVNSQVIYCILGSSTSYFAWKYNIAQNSWTRLNPVMSPSITLREGSMAVYDPPSNSIYIYGGSSSRDETWRWDLTNNYLVQLYPAGIPPYGGRHYSGYFYNESNRSFYILGGWNATSGRTSDVYRYDIALNTWYQITTSGSVEGFEYFTGGGAYNPNTDDFYLAGARTLGTNNCRNAVFRFNFSDSYAPTQIGTFVTSDSKTLGTLAWTHLKNITPTQTSTGSSAIYHSVSFDKKQTFKILSLGTEVSLDSSAVVNKGGGKIGLPATSHGLSSGNKIRVYGTTNYNNNYTVDADTTTHEIVVVASYVSETLTSTAKCRITTWKTIVQLNSTTWQYLDGSSSWQNASSNDVYTALKQAFGVAANRMIGTDLAAISQWEWELTDGFVPATTASIDFGVGFVGSNADIPFLTSYAVTHSCVYNDITLITSNWVASANDPTKVHCNIELEPIDSITLDTDLKAWASIDDGSHYEQITGLSIIRQSGTHVYVGGTKSGVTARGDKTMRLKITSHNSKNVYIHAAALEARYN